MSDNLPVSRRRYSEKEVSKLLKRTAELQRASPTAPNSRGLSLGELEEIAAEAGLDVELLRQAASELDSSNPTARGLGVALAGGPMRLIVERTVPFEASPAAYESVVALIQIAAPSPGSATQIGRTLTWQSHGSNNTMTLNVVVSVRSGETLVRIEENHSTFAGALFGGGLGGGAGLAIGVGGGVGGVLGSALVGVGLPVVILGATYLGFRSIFAGKSRKRYATLNGLADNIVAELTSAADKPDTG